MFKRYFFTSLCFFYSTAEQTSLPFSKAQQLSVLTKIAEQINRLDPLHEYTVTVPPFFVVTNHDIYQFLAGIPSLQKPSPKGSKKAKPESMLDYIQGLWHEIIKSKHKKNISPHIQQLLDDIRHALDDAFKHDITYNNPQLAQFVKTAERDNKTLIVRNAAEQPLLEIKSTYPVKALQLSQAIGNSIKSYFYDSTIEQLIQQDNVPPDFYASVIIQTYIVDTDKKNPLISGVCCPQDPAATKTSIAIIEAVYGHPSGLKKESVAHDTYYLLDDMVYPIIRKKNKQVKATLDNMKTMLVSTDASIRELPTLELKAAQEITKITKILNQQYKQPACVSFIKHNHTIYLTGCKSISNKSNTTPNFIDPLYLKKVIKDDVVHIVPISALSEVITIKNEESILFAYDAKQLLQRYHQLEDKELLQLAIIEKAPSIWSKEHKLLSELPVTIILSSRSTHIKEWVKSQKWPLVVDIQSKYMFPYKRKKGFCTLYQTLLNGFSHYPITENISVISSFRKPLTLAEKKLLNPDEFFSGVTIEHLFDLLKVEDPETALQALQTILYRLHNKIKRISLDEPELRMSKSDYDKQLQQLKELTEYIEQVAYQLYTYITAHIKTKTKQSLHDLELLFMINTLKQMVMQHKHNDIVNSISFNELAATML